MANVLLALRTATTDALTTVSAATKSVTYAATSISDIVAAGAAHAHEYRVSTEKGLERTSKDRELYADIHAQTTISNKLLGLKQELESNPELLEIFMAVRAGDFSLSLNNNPI